MNKLITRDEYLSGFFKDKITHQEYYSQFVNEEVRQKVLKEIGLEGLLKSRDKHLNDIPIKHWDALGCYRFQIVNGEEKAVVKPRTIEDIKPVDIFLLRRAGEVGERNLPSSSTLVSIYKTAGRQILELIENNRKK